MTDLPRTYDFMTMEHRFSPVIKPTQLSSEKPKCNVYSSVQIFTMLKGPQHRHIITTSLTKNRCLYGFKSCVDYTKHFSFTSAIERQTIWVAYLNLDLYILICFVTRTISNFFDTIKLCPFN